MRRIISRGKPNSPEHILKLKKLAAERREECKFCGLRTFAPLIHRYHNEKCPERHKLKWQYYSPLLLKSQRKNNSQ
jgi:hypothetical protein